MGGETPSGFDGRVGSRSWSYAISKKPAITALIPPNLVSILVSERNNTIPCKKHDSKIQ